MTNPLRILVRYCPFCNISKSTENTNYCECNSLPFIVPKEIARLASYGFVTEQLDKVERSHDTEHLRKTK
jgi:hypothetical protein